MTDKSFVKVEVSVTFNRNLRTLAKKYRRIRSDIEPIIKQLQNGELPGNQISGIGYKVFKLRVKNSDVAKGKSGGYRLIYYCKTTTGIILLTIYTKSEQIDIAAEDIKRIISQYKG
ncbi:cytotoxic translational repressor of toxin-antitoxin stability system [Xenococcus sp. PCC 7305]|uniref:type II toxin-antitoxin system RelE/ParE family toxin n=1 Tax=Xenococcus sp. PCC 7305 TaxID=102125 RepID=UPI0002ACB777|nr:type II toxin-antitoxin system RelE/ParE family toxin [Xenococcus sp. PCC 7305]ELS00818.1 cytotoxic translational repressor of toxin-antitoxin stability system [Xenococcus sp. PCC 7305]